MVLYDPKDYEIQIDPRLLSSYALFSAMRVEDDGSRATELYPISHIHLRSVHTKG